jgi:hypothetical protein
LLTILYIYFKGHMAAVYFIQEVVTKFYAQDCNLVNIFFVRVLLNIQQIEEKYVNVNISKP